MGGNVPKVLWRKIMSNVNAKDVYEWEFPEPSHLVDLKRVYDEMRDIPFIVARAYMANLKMKAPVVYERFKVYAQEENIMTWYKWDTDGAKEENHE